MTHVTPVCTNLMDCAMMESFYSPGGFENLVWGFAFAIVVVSLMVAGMSLNRWWINRKKRRA